MFAFRKKPCFTLTELIILILVTGILALAALVGCASSGTINDGAILAPDGICIGPTKYIDRNGIVQTMVDPSTTTLCMLDPYPDKTKLTLFIVNDALLRKGTYTADQVIDFTSDVRGFINEPNATARTVVTKTAMLIKNWPELYIVGNMMKDPRYQSDLPIDDFTAYFIDKHLDEQDAIALMFKN